jgi:hypothetical protein
MVKTLTAAQTAALADDSQRPCFAIKIDLTSDLLYTSWSDQVTLSATDYTPRALTVSATNISDPQSSRATVIIDDLDGTIATAWYNEPGFSGQTVTITEAIYDAGAWVAVRTIPWICTTCDRTSDGKFILHLSGAGGLRPRDGLEVAARAGWSMAPSPGTSVQVGYTTTTVE